MKFYVIENRYVGPNRNNLETDWENIVRGHSYDIQNEPGRTNMSGQIKMNGWLGNSNDCWSAAHGEFETIEAAEAFIQEHADDTVREAIDHPDVDLPHIVARYYVGPENYWDAGDWLDGVVFRKPGFVKVDDEIITPNTTNEELEKLAEELETKAQNNGIELWYTMKTLEEYRDWAKESLEE